MENDIKEYILKILREERDAALVDQLNETDNMIENGLLDSMSFLELLTSLELAYNVSIDFGEIDPNEFLSLGGLSKLVACQARANN